MIETITHPAWHDEYDDWCKYRLTYCGGRAFVDRYLERFSRRESATDFCTRKKITPCPAFAKAAINEIKNVIFNRLRDVVRISPSGTYSKCSQGLLRGVDNGGATMDYFIGQYVVPELLTMRKVGVYIDMPPEVPGTLTVSKNIHPYLYLYGTESIRSWKYTEAANPKEFESVLLYENQLTYDSVTKLPNGKQERYRHVYLRNGKVQVEFYDLDGKNINSAGEYEEVIYTLDIEEIPFVIFEISDSLLKDVADYQIALLNMESADISYAISSNFPLYIEQYDENLNNADDLPEFVDEDGSEATEVNVTEAREKEAKVGPVYGRQYPKNSNPPQFIHPSPEPLQAAMEKEKQIKKDIKLLINLAVNDLSDKMVSAESKKQDESGKQTGLACIAYVLENGEQKLARYWGNYESKGEDGITVSYPKDYDLKSEEDRLKDCEELWAIVAKVPSSEFKKQVLKKIAALILGNKVNAKVLDTVSKEIDSSPGLLCDIESIIQAVEKGLVDKKSASKLIGFIDGLVEKAKEEHAEELALIQESQGGEGGAARGVPATQGSQPSSSAEKKNKPKRGAGK